MHYLYLIAKDCQSFDEVLIIGQVMIYNIENEIIIGIIIVKNSLVIKNLNLVIDNQKVWMYYNHNIMVIKNQRRL